MLQVIFNLNGENHPFSLICKSESSETKVEVMVCKFVDYDELHFKTNCNKIGSVVFVARNLRVKCNFGQFSKKPN